MTAYANRKARERLDAKLTHLQPVNQYQVPHKGWIKAIRQALGMSGVQLANRLGVSAQTANALEKSEVNASIKLDTLQKAAEALNCTLVYALVPKSSLEETVNSRTKMIAKKALKTVSHTMKLEDQSVSAKVSDQQIEDYIQNILKERDIWRQF
jgi:predicted DNA-binding mobile mystery protein A